MAEIQREKPLPTFTDNKFYVVQLYKMAQHSGRTFTPGHRIIMRGDIAKAIAESIYEAEERSGEA